MPDNDETETKNKIISKKTLFLIGLSAGIIAAVFPRLLPSMTQTSSVVSIELFNEGFYYAVAGFASMIGVAMIWFYSGTREHTKNLFMSALALPAVLSGGINMNSVSSIAGENLAELEGRNQALHKKLEDGLGIDFLELKIDSDAQTDDVTILDFIGISSAYAAGLSKKESDLSSVRFKMESLERNYTLVYEVSDSESVVKQKEQELKLMKIENLMTIKIDNKFYLLQDDRKTKTEVLLEAIELKDEHDFTPGIVKLK